MRNSLYRKRFGSYQLVGAINLPLLNSPEIYWQGESIALLVDIEAGVLLKHGCEKEVRQYRSKMLDSFNGYDDIFRVFCSSEWDIDEINKCLECSGYVMKMLENSKMWPIKIIQAIN